MRLGVIFYVPALLLCLTSFAQAACTRPPGTEGEVVYNKDQKTMQYCNGSKWVGMAWDDTEDTVTGDLKVGGVINTPYARYNIFRYQSTQTSTNGWVHLKTNHPKNTNKMITLEFQGYDYGALKTIASQISYYAYTPISTVKPISVGTTGTHTLDTYYSADGYVVVSMQVNSYFLGFHLNQYKTNPASDLDIAITATAFTAASTGAF